MRKSQIKVYGSNILWLIVEFYIFNAKKMDDTAEYFDSIYDFALKKLETKNSNAKIQRINIEKLTDYDKSFENVAFKIQKKELIVNAGYIYPLVKYFVYSNMLVDNNFEIRNFISCNSDFFIETEKKLITRYSSKNVFFELLCSFQKSLSSINRTMSYWAIQDQGE